jgi:hypothetical protein
MADPDPDDPTPDDPTPDEPTTEGRPPEPKPLSDDDVRDALPDDLDARGYVGPYLFPNNNRRRIPAIIYWVIAAGCLVLWFVTKDDNPVLVNGGYVAAAVGLILFGAYSWVSGWDLDVDERDALVVAVRRVGFPVGHASAQMGWRGLLSRPTWRILLYSAEEPPEKRGLVLVDGVQGDVVEWFVEDNPEDWAEMDKG